ncbi:MAG: universal stress protein [Rhodobacter sp.]|nr:universal stress protein [Rhodobacter sp.]
MYRKILVPIALDHDVSPQTLKIARDLCDDGGEIIALHVHEEPQGSAAAVLPEALVEEGVNRAKELMAQKLAGVTGVTARLAEGRSYRTIVEFAADNGVDCIVMGSHKPGLGEFLLGSTAARVVRHAPCAVHVYRSS